MRMRVENLVHRGQVRNAVWLLHQKSFVWSRITFFPLICLSVLWSREFRVCKSPGAGALFPALDLGRGPRVKGSWSRPCTASGRCMFPRVPTLGTPGLSKILAASKTTRYKNSHRTLRHGALVFCDRFFPCTNSASGGCLSFCLHPQGFLLSV